MKKTLKGFTLIEMLIVIVIIGILAAVLIPKIGGAREKAQDVAIKANVRNYGQALLQAQLANESLSGKSIDDINGGDFTTKYGAPSLSDDDLARYELTIDSDGKFVVCGEIYAEDGAGGNSTENNNVDFTETTTGTYFCYKG